MGSSSSVCMVIIWCILTLWNMHLRPGARCHSAALNAAELLGRGLKVYVPRSADVSMGRQPFRSAHTPAASRSSGPPVRNLKAKLLGGIVW